MKKRISKKETEKILMCYGQSLSGADMKYSENCPDYYILADYICGLLSAGSEERIKKHLAECVFCIGELADMHRAINCGDKEIKCVVTSEVSESIKNLVPGRDIVSSRAGILFSECIVCENCGTRTVSDHNFCFNCGFLINSDLKCCFCSAGIKEGDNYCPGCGKKMTADKKTVNKILIRFSDFIPDGIKENKWFGGAIAMILASLAFPAVFLQFLTAAGIFAGVWLFDKTKIKKVQEIYMIWNRGEEDKAIERVKELKKEIEKKNQGGM